MRKRLEREKMVLVVPAFEVSSAKNNNVIQEETTRETAVSFVKRGILRPFRFIPSFSII